MRLILALLLLLPFAAEAKKENTFRVRLSEDLGSLDWNYGELNSEVVYQLMEGLFRSDHLGRPRPAAAASFTFNKEKTELKLKLRANRVWSDGKPLCAQHFADSWDRLRSKTFASPFAHYASVMKDYTVDGCHNLRVTFTRPTPEALALLAHYVFFPLRLDNLDPSPFNEGTKLLVNGPFRVAEWKQNVLLALVRNEKFAGTRAKLDRVEFRFIQEDNTAKAMFELGELDWMKEVPQLLRSPELEKSPDFRIFPSLIAYYYGLHAPKSKLLEDPEIRRSLSAALDRSEIPKILGKECQGTSSWLLPELLPGWKPPPAPVLDPKARERLHAALKGGKHDLVLRLYNKTNHKILAEWAQGQWEKKLGIRIPIEVQEGKVYWKEIGTNPAPIFFGGVTAPFGHPRAFLQEFLSGASANWTGWASPEFDAALAAEKFAEAERILERDGHVIPIYRRQTVALVKAKWKGFVLNPLGQAYLSEVR